MSAEGRPHRPGANSAVIWHELECAAYSADLALWRELAGSVGDPILDLGCGSGRVSLDLARNGFQVHGLDLDPDLVAELNLRARAAALPAAATVGDAREFSLPERFAMVLAPMQLIQILKDASQRVSCLRCARRHLLPGGTLALAIVDQIPAELIEEAPPPLPDSREVDGWLYSSLPLDAPIEAGAIVVRRLRQTVSPAGELTDQLEEIPLRLLSSADLEAEALEASLQLAGRCEVAPTDTYVGSTVVILRAP